MTASEPGAPLRIDACSPMVRPRLSRGVPTSVRLIGRVIGPAWATRSTESNMSMMNNVVRVLVDNAKDIGRRVFDAQRAEGFENATTICIGVLSKNIDDLMNKPKSGSYLNDEEQFLLSRLTEIKSAIEQDLLDYRGSTATYETRNEAAEQPR